MVPFQGSKGLLHNYDRNVSRNIMVQVTFAEINQILRHLYGPMNTLKSTFLFCID